MRTVVNLKTLHAGFDPTGVLLFQIHSDQQVFQGKQRLALQKTIVEHLRTIPGVTSASEGLVVSLSGNRVDGDVDVEGYEVKPGENNRAYFNLVGPSFFHTVGTELLLGREFQERDTPASPPVAVVNQAFAHHYFGSKSPIGRWVNGATIIGLVENTKYLDLRQAFPETVYFAASQDTTPEPITYLVRVGTGEPQAVWESVRRIVRTVNPQWRVMEATSMTHLFDASIQKERILALLSSCFGSTALLLTCVGIFGALAAQVAQRTHEFGIRMALGAQKTDILQTVLAELAGVLGSGVVIGLAVSMVLTKLARGLLFGVQPLDLFAFALAVMALTIAALMAAYLPARQATIIDPAEALRVER